MIEIKALFDLAHTQAADYFSAFRYPWEALDGIKQMILDLGEKLPVDEYEQRAEGEGIPERVSRCTMYHRPGDGGSSLCFYTRFRTRRRKLRCR